MRKLMPSKTFLFIYIIASVVDGLVFISVLNPEGIKSITNSGRLVGVILSPLLVPISHTSTLFITVINGYGSHGSWNKPNTYSFLAFCLTFIGLFAVSKLKLPSISR